MSAPLAAPGDDLQTLLDRICRWPASHAGILSSHTPPLLTVRKIISKGPPSTIVVTARGPKAEVRRVKIVACSRQKRQTMCASSLPAGAREGCDPEDRALSCLESKSWADQAEANRAEVQEFRKLLRALQERIEESEACMLSLTQVRAPHEQSLVRQAARYRLGWEITEDNLWKTEERSLQTRAMANHHLYGLCGWVKSHPVLYACGHGHSYQMFGEPFRHFAEEAALAAVYPEREDKSEVDYSWKGLKFALLPWLCVVVPDSP
ncbi:hypothetical protein B0H17DRAFT_1214489 [Mycena rosella]|uniref:Uncharacterized protein n=1 Tax=Mycena rosella TaxID=1033263 RepID=A0AAD7CMX5_MYCRO|nr:hypothetical protein B0H17DRAFT_1214489 [Mycena rosella]